MNQNHAPNRARVVISDFDMPFWSLTIFLVKVAVASIPATVILSVIVSAIMAVCFILMSMLGIFGTILNALGN